MVDKFFDKVIIITGAAGFLGSHYCNYLAKKNNLVIAVDKNKKGLKKLSSKNNLLTYCIDITLEKQIIKFIKFIKKKKLNIDVLINNAAIDSVPSDTSKKLDVESLKKEINVSLIGPYLLINYISRHMNKKNKNYSIINIGSDLSVIAPNQNIYKGIFKNFQKPVSYSIVKHGLLGITKYYSSLLAERRIKVNMISPGPIFNNQNKKFINRLNKIIPMSRMGKPSDIYPTLDLLIDEKNSFMTGQNILIDGGRTVI